MIAEGIAVWSAIERVVEAMQAHYAAELAALSSYGVPLPAPDAGEYFVDLNEPEVESAVKNASVAVIVYQDRDSTTDDRQTHTPSTNLEVQSTYIGLKIVYRLRPSQPVPMLGKTPTVSDIMATRGYLYSAAAIQTVRKYACDGVAIDDIEKVADHAAVEFDEDFQPMLGVVTLAWRFTQHVAVSTCAN